ncbi:DUF3130 family protein [Listeria booriae]|uniref:DUF3130 family protein n=1 Tax=Listeria booriae TaxID=1552123 RepID=A0A7X1DLB6_9LIST|nr:DUF3130 family protein [Listeria booriae]MBC2283656.1 DUF3130 family protein [Listeria booriae]MBC2293217.1 DUF3130 family protein [Listeria booriae]MBC2303582.1 DUF3130 family protein [Listeria booriae]MBC2311997.1 DUF3130 family protein [Listeria booriae]
MAKISENREIMMNHAADLSASVQGMAYHPMKNGNMSYTQSHSISQYRACLLELLEAVDIFKSVFSEGAKRMKQIGEAYAQKDREVGQKLQLEVR